MYIEKNISDRIVILMTVIIYMLCIYVNEEFSFFNIKYKI